MILNGGVVKNKPKNNNKKKNKKNVLDNAINKKSKKNIKLVAEFKKEKNIKDKEIKPKDLKNMILNGGNKNKINKQPTYMKAEPEPMDLEYDRDTDPKYINE
jgi:hypothetical protein